MSDEVWTPSIRTIVFGGGGGSDISNKHQKAYFTSK